MKKLILSVLMMSFSSTNVFAFTSYELLSQSQNSEKPSQSLDEIKAQYSKAKFEVITAQMELYVAKAALLADQSKKFITVSSKVLCLPALMSGFALDMFVSGFRDPAVKTQMKAKYAKVSTTMTLAGAVMFIVAMTADLKQISTEISLDREKISALEQTLSNLETQLDLQHALDLTEAS